MPALNAAWLRAHGARLEVGPAPDAIPGPDELVVANHAVAVNPVDWIVQDIGRLIFGWIKPPFVLGSDLAGEVVHVGSAVTRFAVGDRVLAHATGIDKSRNSAAEGSFQDRTLVLERMTSPIPDTVSYQDAAVLPLGLSTAACGLFQRDHLDLAHPRATPVPTGETVLIWGGSTSVGSNAIQLAVAAGYDVLTTASPRNTEYVTRLGAGTVVDHHRPTAVTDAIAALRGRTVAGALAIGEGSARTCSDVIAACKGRKFVSIVTPPASMSPAPSNIGQFVRAMPRSAAAMTSLTVLNRHRRIDTATVFGTTLMNNEVCQMIYQDFLPAALADSRYTTAPPAHVVGTGLEQIQEALYQQKKGVSAQKLVVTL
jgi:NADPH:quinone reductase-like Zn-dependent oxidoreductase